MHNGSTPPKFFISILANSPPKLTSQTTLEEGESG